MKKWITSLLLSLMVAAGIAAPNLHANAAVQTGWSQSGGHWFYNANGSLKTGWLFTGGKWYYLDNSGVMQTGWVLANGKWYYLNNSGAMQTGWMLANGKWYFLNANGDMRTGWLRSGSTWYYLDNSGAMTTGWKTVGGKQYYFAPSGAMAVNTTIGGNRIGSDGAVVSVRSVTKAGIISITNPAPRNSTATLNATVSPNSVATIAVHYKSGDSRAKGLEPKRSDASGNVSWSWHVGGNTTIGPVDVTVSCNGRNYNIIFNVVH